MGNLIRNGLVALIATAFLSYTTVGCDNVNESNSGSNSSYKAEKSSDEFYIPRSTHLVAHINLEKYEGDNLTIRVYVPPGSECHLSNFDDVTPVLGNKSFVFRAFYTGHKDTVLERVKNDLLTCNLNAISITKYEKREEEPLLLLPFTESERATIGKTFAGTPLEQKISYGS